MIWGHSRALTPESSEHCYPKPSAFVCSLTTLACHFVPDLLSGQTCPSDLADSLFRAEGRSRSMWCHEDRVCVMLGVSYLCSVRRCRGDQGAGTQLAGDRKGISREQGTEQVLS